MEEKKLTDEELKQAFFILRHGSSEGLSEYIKAVLAIESEYNRQKAEIERLTEKVENQKAVIKGQNKAIEKEKSENKRLYDEYVRLDDFCAGKGCICCVCENKKTCNECKTCGSLKTEKCNGFRIDVSKYARAIERADKLQKQVDELKKENGQLVTIGNGFALERNNLREELDELKKSGRKIPENAVVLTEKEYKRYERIEKIIKLAKREKANGYEVKNGKLYYFSNMLDGFEYEFKDLQEICDAANHYNEEFCGLDQRLAFWQGKAEETRKETAEKFAERLKETATKEIARTIFDEFVYYRILEDKIDEIVKEITEGKANASKTKL